MHVRQATIQDTAQLAALSTQLGYSPSEPETRSRLSQLLELPTHLILVAEEGQQLAGWASAEYRISMETGPRVEITGLVVDASARRIGIGSMLVEQVEHWAVGRNCPVLLVRSNVVREESHPFYERLGYERTKTQHSYRKVLNGG